MNKREFTRLSLQEKSRNQLNEMQRLKKMNDWTNFKISLLEIPDLEDDYASWLKTNRNIDFDRLRELEYEFKEINTIKYLLISELLMMGYADKHRYDALPFIPQQNNVAEDYHQHWRKVYGLQVKL